MTLRSALPVLVLVSIGISHGAVYSTTFDTGFNPALEVAGQDGWVINDATPDLSFFVTYNFTNAAALGGFYDAPVNPAVRLSHPVSTTLATSSLNVNFAIVPSTINYPDRDSFGYSFQNGSGTNLLTILFEPDVTDPLLLNIKWSTGAGSPTATGWAVFYDGPYFLGVDFADGGGGAAAFTANVVGSNVISFNGTLPGFANETISSVGADFIQKQAATGDNYMIFDNFSLVPEPTTSVMFIGALAVPLLRRRRR